MKNDKYWLFILSVGILSHKNKRLLVQRLQLGRQWIHLQKKWKRLLRPGIRKYGMKPLIVWSVKHRSVHVYMYVCVYTYILIYTFKYMFTYICTYVNIYKNVGWCLQWYETWISCLWMYQSLCEYMNKDTYIRVYIYVYIYTYIYI